MFKVGERLFSGAIEETGCEGRDGVLLRSEWSECGGQWIVEVQRGTDRWTAVLEPIPQHEQDRQLDEHPYMSYADDVVVVECSVDEAEALAA